MSNTYLFKLLHTELKASDCQKAINIPKLVDPNGLTPAECWDFSEFNNVIDDHANITRERALLYAEHCMPWGVNFIECLTNVTIEMQDQEWALTTAKNSCTNGLKVKIASTFDKLPGHQQTGVVYIWLMLDIHIGQHHSRRREGTERATETVCNERIEGLLPRRGKR